MSKLDRDRAKLVVVDVQEAFRRYPTFGEVAEKCSVLLRGARIMELPRIVTEQYPKGLGHTVAEVGLDGEEPIAKSIFSAARAEGFTMDGRDQAIVCGIEAHVCVSQTALDLLEGGVAVHLPADALGSRHAIDYDRALARLEREGAVVSTVETVLFELLGRAGTPEFKAVQELII